MLQKISISVLFSFIYLYVKHFNDKNEPECTLVAAVQVYHVSYQILS